MANVIVLDRLGVSGVHLVPDILKLGEILLCVVAGGKLYWGTWEIVFGAGSFFIALPMLALTLLSHYEL